MLIKNGSRKAVLARHTRICSTPLSKAAGLMFSKKLHDECLLMVFDKETRVDLHMLFVFFPIDVLFLDANKRVVETRQRMLPFISYVHPSKKAKYVLELPASAISKSKTLLGDIIQFRE